MSLRAGRNDGEESIEEARGAFGKLRQGGLVVQEPDEHAQSSQEDEQNPARGAVDQVVDAGHVNSLQPCPASQPSANLYRMYQVRCTGAAGSPGVAGTGMKQPTTSSSTTNATTQTRFGLIPVRRSSACIVFPPRM